MTQIRNFYKINSEPFLAVEIFQTHFLTTRARASHLVSTSDLNLGIGPMWELFTFLKVDRFLLRLFWFITN